METEFSQGNVTMRVDGGIESDSEPAFREFFAGLAPQCENREVQDPPPPREKRRLFGRRG